MTPLEAFRLDLGTQSTYPPVPNFGPLLGGSGFNGARYFKKWYQTTDGGPLLLTAKRGQFTAWLSEPVFTNTSKELLTKTLQGSKEATIRRQAFVAIMEQMDQQYDQTTYAYLEHQSITALQAQIHTIFDTIWDANAMAFFCFFLDKSLCQNVLDECSINLPLEDLWERATISTTPSFETCDFLELLKKRQAGISNETFVEYSQFTTCSYVRAGTLEEIDAQNQHVQTIPIEHLDTDIKTIETEWEEKQAHYEHWKQTLPLAQQTLVDYLQTIIFLRDARKRLFRKGLTIIWRISQILTKPLGIPEELLPFITRTEITDDLEQLHLNLPTLLTRLEGFVHCITTEGQEYKNIESIEPIDIALRKQHFGEDTQSLTLKGQPASPGLVTASARVILHKEDFSSFQPGEILVTGMTRPEFVPLMKKASGIVTDEGGITCHAAIVSRELGIPCVIGTKKATHWIKSNTQITVDGNTGLITKSI